MPYNPQKDAVVISKPFGAIGFPIDSRSFFYDEANFVRRAFVSTAEVLACFDTPFKREGMFYVFVNSTGTLQPDGTILGGERVAYWWKEGTADEQLTVVVEKGDKGDKGDTGSQGIQGFNGWQPDTDIVTVDGRQVEIFTQWIGGTGTQPTTYVGMYRGDGEWVTDPADAIDMLAEVSEIAIDNVKQKPPKTIGGDGFYYLDGYLSQDGTKIVNNYDRFTGTPFNATKVTTWVDGSAMIDGKVDNVIYFKNPAALGGGYSRRDLDGLINLKWFGAIGDGVTVDSPAVQKAFNTAILLGLTLFVPEGTYMLSSDIAQIVLNFTMDGQNLRVLGEGRGKSIFKDVDGTVLRGGRYTRTFFLQASYQIGDISFEHLTFDKNGASNGPEPSHYEWEQAHIISFVKASTLNTVSIKSYSVKSCNIKDKVGGGVHMACAFNVGSVTIEDYYEEDFSGLVGERGDIEITCFSKNVNVNRANIRYMQTEAINGYQSTEENQKVIKITDTSARTLQFGEVVMASKCYTEIILDRVTTSLEMSARNVNITATNSLLRFPIEHWGEFGKFTNCDILLPYDETTNEVKSIYVKKVFEYKQLWNFSTCKIKLDTTNLAVLAVGNAVGKNTHAKCTSIDEVMVKFSNCTFDGRMQGVASSYQTGSVSIINSKLACWGRAFQVGGATTYTGYLYLSNNDYTNCIGIPLLDISTSNTLWKLEWIGEIPTSKYNVTSSSGSSGWDGFIVKPTLVGDTVPTAGRYFKGQYLKPQISTGVEVGYICTVSGNGASAVWRQVSYISSGTTAQRPTVTLTGFGYFNTTTGRQEWWNGTDWVGVLSTQGTDVAATSSLVVPATSEVFEITGTTTINRLSNTGRQNGAKVTLLFESTPTVKHAQTVTTTNLPILLIGAVDFIATAGDSLTLCLSEMGGVQAWREVARSVNRLKNGTYTVNGSGQTTINIAHGMGTTPSFTNVSAKSADARTAGINSWTEDATNIIITLSVAAGAGTNNLIYSWEAKL